MRGLGDMNMKAKDELSKVSNSKDMIVEFNNGIKAAVSDIYCTNPDCRCAVATLEFIEIGENHSHKGKLFSFKLDTQTWEVSKVKTVNPNIDVKTLIQEFTDGLGTSLKETYSKRAKEAKTYVKGHIVNWFDDLDEADGSCFCYSEVYVERDSKKFSFEYMGTKYFVADKYCTSPECKCNVAVLAFLNIIPGRETPNNQFVLRLSLITGEHEVDYKDNIEKEDIKLIFNTYMEHIHNDLGLLRSRYANMREFGKKRALRKKEKQNAQIASSSKVGRNDPCPCGSGKKYKKCCGAS